MAGKSSYLKIGMGGKVPNPKYFPTAGGGMGGGGPKPLINMGGDEGHDNPWEKKLEEMKFDNPYSGYNRGLAAKLGTLGNRDYSGEMYDLMSKGLDRAREGQRSALARRGMGELGFSEDVAQDWSERYTDAATQAKISGAEMQRAALQTAVQGIQSMSGTELDYMMAELRKVFGGGDMWMEYEKMLGPLMEKLGYHSGGGGGGDFTSPVKTGKSGA